MFVNETPNLTGTDVIERLEKRVRDHFGRFTASVANWREHPSYNTKTGLRNQYQQLLGVIELYRDFKLSLGDDTFPDWLEEKRLAARELHASI